MILFLIRHGETEHNIAGLLAGVTDSRLTNHGLIQAQRLAAHLVTTRKLLFSQVFTSNLQRAQKTANELCSAQNAAHRDAVIDPITLTILQEQDLGSFELLPWNRSDTARQSDPGPETPGFKPKETPGSMKVRADAFIDDYLVPLLALDAESEQHVAVISHGLFLGAFWRTMLLRFRPSTVKLKLDTLVPGTRKPLEYLPSWSNTGFLDLRIRLLPEINDSSSGKQVAEATPTEQSFLLNATMEVRAVNSKEHLSNLKRTRGGLGSSASDGKQKNLDVFFKKQKSNPRNEKSLKPENVSNTSEFVSKNLQPTKGKHFFVVLNLWFHLMTINFTQTCSEIQCRKNNCTNCCLSLDLLILNRKSP